MEFLAAGALADLLMVIAIDVALAGDNAIVVGMAAAGLPAEQRKRAIIVGIAAAAVMRIVFALFTVQLLQVVGLMFAGGLLLLWVSWKLWRELAAGPEEEAAEAEGEHAVEGEDVPVKKGKDFRSAVTQIIIADVSMSLDNVLAVAGAARDHTWVLVAGLALSVALMGLAASVVARLLQRHRWVAYVGLAIILYVATTMIWDGAKPLLALASPGA
ncbi:MAG TPA: YjbE family putative metal transport protein [Candidatus Omnitrophota bacterium]|nr:YjbE family putative metal transport protein [Candidatus Omnitrophota bacterium]